MKSVLSPVKKYSLELSVVLLPDPSFSVLLLRYQDRKEDSVASQELFTTTNSSALILKNGHHEKDARDKRREED